MFAVLLRMPGLSCVLFVRANSSRWKKPTRSLCAARGLAESGVFRRCCAERTENEFGSDLDQRLADATATPPNSQLWVAAISIYLGPRRAEQYSGEEPLRLELTGGQRPSDGGISWWRSRKRRVNRYRPFQMKSFPLLFGLC